MQVLVVRTDAGVFVTKNPDFKPYGQGLRGYEYKEMTEEEYESIPTSEAARKFFKGELVAERAD